MPETSPLPILAFATLADWEAWLAQQPGASPGVWLKLAKKGADQPSVSRSDAIDAALCQWWIDGMLRPFDESFWLIRFTPRRAKSKWSALNQSRVQALTAQGRMRPAGLAQVEAAKADGRWEGAYQPQSKAEVPEDLRQALDAAPDASGLFDRLDSTNRYAILYRLHNCKTADTRARNLAKFVAMLARGETIYPLKAKPPQTR